MRRLLPLLALGCLACSGETGRLEVPLYGTYEGHDSIVAATVAEPDLIIVTSLMLALASHDFYISVFRDQKGPALDTGPSLESLPTGVSGKPAAPPTQPEKTPAARKKPAAKRETSKTKK